jgi:filamentous hemagglutinin
MNKNLHRIVFNAARGICMVVQETARSAGKARSGGTAAATRAAPSTAAAVLFGVLVVAPNAPGTQRPTALVAPNGVPLVNRLS